MGGKNAKEKIVTRTCEGRRGAAAYADPEEREGRADHREHYAEEAQGDLSSALAA